MSVVPVTRVPIGEAVDAVGGAVKEGAVPGGSHEPGEYDEESRTDDAKKERVMRKSVLVVLSACLMFACGCTETFTSMKVKKDGSGTITLKVHVSDQAMKQIAGAMTEAAAAMAGAMAEAMADGVGEVAAEADAKAAAVDTEKIKADVRSGMAEVSTVKMPSLYDEQRLRQMAKLFGQGVTFVSGKESSTKAGWKGFVANYAFEDVSKVSLCPDVGELMMTMQQGGGKLPEAVPGYTFALEKGDAGTTLKIMPPPVEAEAEAEAVAAAGKTDTGTFTEVNEDELEAAGAEMEMQMGAAMEQQMMKAMKGKKDSVLIVVDGEVTESNAKYRPKSTPNVILLYHMDFDKVMASEDGKKAITGGAEIMDMVAKGVPGVIAEDPKKIITVSFE